MCLINATRKNSTYSVVNVIQYHSKWKLMYVCVCVCVCVCLCTSVYVCACNGNTSPINSLKAKDKLKITRWKVKTYPKHLWYWGKIMCEWIFLLTVCFKCWRNKFTASFFQKIREITILILCYLRILTGKKLHQMKLQRLQKVQIWAFGLLVQQINLL